jgi:hypothetical protein
VERRSMRIELERLICPEYAFKLRESCYRDYWRAAVAHKAAELIADHPRGEEPLSQREAEALGEGLLRDEELARVRVPLEELPEEALGGRGRWPLVAVVYAAQSSE